MTGILIAAFIIVIIMNFFLFYIIKKLVSNISQKVRTLYVGKLQVYDDLIEQKEKRLNEVNEEIEKLSLEKEELITYIAKNSKETRKTAVTVSAPTLADDFFLETYRTINEAFGYDEEKVINDFIEYVFDDKDNKIYDLVISIKQKLTFDIKFKLLTLSPEDQVANLLKMLSEDEDKILDDYIKGKKKFNCTDFDNYLDEVIEKNDPYIYIKTGDKENSFEHMHENIKTLYDSNIAKGIEIIYKNKRYDYAL